MLKGQDTFPVDELYLTMIEGGKVHRMGIKNGVVVPDDLVDPRKLKPSVVRVIGSLHSIPILLAARNTYNVPVEMAPVPEVLVNSSLRDIIVQTRDIHKVVPEGHWLKYCVMSDTDLYNFGLTYNVMTRKLKLPEMKFDKEDLDFCMDMKYVDHALERHAMSDAFANEHAIDFCALMIDPRLHFFNSGFNYYELSRLLGASSIEMACQLTRRFIDLHGTSPLPEDPAAFRTLATKVLKDWDDKTKHPIQMLGLRTIHGILTAPMDNLDVNIGATNTRLARDSEVVRQCLHGLCNKWLSRIYGDRWVCDEYSPELFDRPAEEEN